MAGVGATAATGAGRAQDAAGAGGPHEDDDLGDALLDAAARVFARQGYEGTRIGDVVRQAGLSTGAIYGRFRSREDLLRRAVITRSVPHLQAPPDGVRVGDLVVRGAARVGSELSDVEALVLEAFVAARRHPEIAEALGEATARWREEATVVVDAALADGSLSDDLDVDAVLYFVRLLRVGRLLMRASGLPPPRQEAWETLLRRVIASLGPERPGAGGAESGVSGPERPGAGGAESGVSGPERPGAGGAESGVSGPERPGAGGAESGVSGPERPGAGGAESGVSGPERPGAGGAESGVSGPERPGAGGAESGVSGPERPGAGGAESGVSGPADLEEDHNGRNRT